MSAFKEPCRHCGSLIESDSRFCPNCESQSPFADLCPSCLKEITRSNKICSGCGKRLYISCPKCQNETFVSEKCDNCGEKLMKRCQNPRCRQMQFFENKKCTACGKRFK